MMDLPCAVVPFHWPTLFDEEDGDAGPLLHAEASPPASVPTSITAFVRVHISGLQRCLFRVRTGPKSAALCRPAQNAKVTSVRAQSTAASAVVHTASQTRCYRPHFPAGFQSDATPLC